MLQSVLNFDAFLDQSHERERNGLPSKRLPPEGCPTSNVRNDVCGYSGTRKGHSGSGRSGLPTGVDKHFIIAAVCLYSAVIQ